MNADQRGSWMESVHPVTATCAARGGSQARRSSTTRKRAAWSARSAALRSQTNYRDTHPDPRRSGGCRVNACPCGHAGRWLPREARMISLALRAARPRPSGLTLAGRCAQWPADSEAAPTALAASTPSARQKVTGIGTQRRALSGSAPSSQRCSVSALRADARCGAPLTLETDPAGLTARARPEARSKSIVVIWYHLAGHSPAIARDRRGRAPWYAAKTITAADPLPADLRVALDQIHGRPAAH